MDQLALFNVEPIPRRRALTLRQQLAIFRADNFLDCYSGKRLFANPALRMRRLCAGFVYDPSWGTMPEFYTECATVEHVKAVMGRHRGTNDPENLRTTNWANNAEKNSWPLELTRFKLRPRSTEPWDGGMEEFTCWADNNRDLWKNEAWIGRWYRAWKPLP